MEMISPRSYKLSRHHALTVSRVGAKQFQKATLVHPHSMLGIQKTGTVFRDQSTAVPPQPNYRAFLLY